MAGLPMTCEKLWFSSTTTTTWLECGTCAKVKVEKIERIKSKAVNPSCFTKTTPGNWIELLFAGKRRGEEFPASRYRIRRRTEGCVETLRTAAVNQRNL